MPKPEEYNLQRLLEVRERARESAVRFLAQRRQEAAAESEELARRENAVENCRRAQKKAQTAMLEKAAGGIKTSEMLLHQRHLADLREAEIELLAAVERQRTAVARADQAVEDALLALSEATKEMRVIEKHRENWRRTRKVETARREQKTNDEIGAILHERQKDD